jgi:hypothetical protein
MTSHPERSAQANAAGSDAGKVEAATTKRVDELSGLA